MAQSLKLLVGGLALVLLGDSRVVPVGSAFDKGFPHLLELELPSVYYVSATPGITVEDYANSRIPIYSAGTHGALVIALGTNNVRIGESVTQFMAAYRAKITDALNKGWPLSRIIIPSLGWFDAYAGGTEALALSYNSGLLALAGELHTPFLDLWTPVAARFDRSSLYVQEQNQAPLVLHENDAGQRVLADLYKSADLTPLASSPATTGIRLSRRFS